MKNFVLLTILVATMTAGCALFNKAAPSKTDEAGKPIPGTHEAIQPVKDVADAVPYGGAALALILLVTNFLEKVRADKNAKGLMATVRAIEQASQDPAIKDAVAALKVKLSDAHDLTNTQPVIKDILAKL